jgi:hypothetical protein
VLRPSSLDVTHGVGRQENAGRLSGPVNDRRGAVGTKSLDGKKAGLRIEQPIEAEFDVVGALT